MALTSYDLEYIDPDQWKAARAARLEFAFDPVRMEDRYVAFDVDGRAITMWKVPHEDGPIFHMSERYNWLACDRSTIVPSQEDALAESDKDIGFLYEEADT